MSAPSPRSPGLRGRPEWGVVYAWPGCEATALLLPGRYSTQEDAALAADWEASSWCHCGYDAVQLRNGSWAIYEPDDPSVVTAKFVVREVAVPPKDKTSHDLADP